MRYAADIARRPQRHPTLRRAILYARVSTAEQGAPGLGPALRRLDDGTADVLVAATLSRLSRSARDMQATTHQAQYSAGATRSTLRPGADVPDSGSKRRVRAPRRRLCRVAVAGVVALLVVGATTTVAAADAGPVTVRVAARKVASGSVEFAVQHQTDDVWGERLLPSRRFFPADTDIGRWLVSAPLEVGSTELRVAARKVADGRVEFAVQQRTGAVWGERLLPSRRFFPADTAVGRWLVSSPVPLNAAGSGCAPLPDHVPQHTRDRLCLPEAGPNTYRFFYNLNDPLPPPLPLRVGSRVEFYDMRLEGGVDVFFTIVRFKGRQSLLPGNEPRHAVDTCMDHYVWNRSTNPDAPHYYSHVNVLTEASMARTEDGYYTPTASLGINWRGACTP